MNVIYLPSVGQLVALHCGNCDKQPHVGKRRGDGVDTVWLEDKNHSNAGLKVKISQETTQFGLGESSDADICGKTSRDYFKNN